MEGEETTVGSPLEEPTSFSNGLAMPPGWAPPPPDDGAVVPLRPYGLGEIFTGAFRALRRAPRDLLAAGAVSGLLTVLLRLAIGPGTSRTPDGVTHLHTAASVLLASVGLLAGVTTFAVVVRATLRLVAGQPLRPPTLWRAALERLPALLVVALIRVGVLVLLCVTLVGIPAGVWLFVRWSMAPAVTAAEELGPIAALRRSVLLVRGSWWRVLGLLVVINGAGIVIGAIVGAFAGITDPHHLGTQHLTTSPTLSLAVVSGVIAVFVVPLTIAGTSLLYVDLRCRSEGLAWTLQAARLDPDRPTFGPGAVYATPPWRVETGPDPGRPGR